MGNKFTFNHNRGKRLGNSARSVEKNKVKYVKDNKNKSSSPSALQQFEKTVQSPLKSNKSIMKNSIKPKPIHARSPSESPSIMDMLHVDQPINNEERRNEGNDGVLNTMFNNNQSFQPMLQSPHKDPSKPSKPTIPPSASAEISKSISSPVVKNQPKEQVATIYNYPQTSSVEELRFKYYMDNKKCVDMEEKNQIEMDKHISLDCIYGKVNMLQNTYGDKFVVGDERKGELLENLIALTLMCHEKITEINSVEDDEIIEYQDERVLESLMDGGNDVIEDNEEKKRAQSEPHPQRQIEQGNDDDNNNVKDEQNEEESGSDSDLSSDSSDFDSSDNDSSETLRKSKILKKKKLSKKQLKKSKREERGRKKGKMKRKKDKRLRNREKYVDKNINGNNNNDDDQEKETQKEKKFFKDCALSVQDLDALAVFLKKVNAGDDANGGVE